jgi:type III secretion protein J
MTAFVRERVIMPMRYVMLIRVMLLGVLLSLAACSSRLELFSSASESEANEVLSVLLDAGVSATKNVVKTGVSISVDSQDVARALDILRTRGLPRDRFDGMGQIFRKEGLVSSPLEERARYLYALSQELAGTLTQMDGVVTARVHVVLPERGNVGEAALPSTAAVFIKHQMGYNLDALQPQIRKLVTHAIPGLTEDRVSIALVAAQPLMISRTDSPLQRVILGITVAEDSASILIIIFLILSVIILALVGLLGYVWFKTGLGRRFFLNKKITA